MNNSDITDLIATSVDDGQFRDVDASAIVTRATKRRHRRWIAGALSTSLIVAAVATVVLVTNNEPKRTTVAQPSTTHAAPTTHATAPPARLGPDTCEAPAPTALDGSQLPPTQVLGSATRGTSLSVSILFRGGPRISLTDAQIIVGVPGATAGVGPADQLPPDATLLPKNQLVAKTFTLGDTSPQAVTMPVQIRDAGTYPVFYLLHYTESAGCTPGDQASKASSVMGQIGILSIS